MTKLDTSKLDKSSKPPGETKTEKVKKALKKVKDFTVENLGRRGILTIVIIIGIVIFTIGMLLLGANQVALQDLYQMNNLGLLGGTEYWYRIYDLQREMAINRIIGQLGAILTAIFLIIAALSPISGKGTPYFSEYIRLGLLIFGAVMIYVAVYI